MSCQAPLGSRLETADGEGISPYVGSTRERPGQFARSSVEQAHQTEPINAAKTKRNIPKVSITMERSALSLNELDQSVKRCYFTTPKKSRNTAR